MLWNASVIKGYAIEASDGDIGTVSDFLFDDASWLVRWLVVDTGNWLSGRKVLLPPSVLGRLYAKDRVFAVKLTKQQIKDSPEIDTDRPVSRQMETGVYDYYGWSPYWGTGFYMAATAICRAPGWLRLTWERGVMSRRSPKPRRPRRCASASVEAVTGYHIHASDGEVGHVEDFLVEDADWSIHYLVVDTKNWWPGKKDLISPRSALDIDWTDKLVNLKVDRQTVKDSPTYDPSAPADRASERHFDTY